MTTPMFPTPETGDRLARQLGHLFAEFAEGAMAAFVLQYERAGKKAMPIAEQRRLLLVSLRGLDSERLTLWRDELVRHLEIAAAQPPSTPPANGGPS